MGEQIDALQQLGFEPIAIVPEGTLPASHFMRSLDLPFPVIIDEDNLIHAYFGALDPEFGRPRRTTVLVSRNGLVPASHVGEAVPEAILDVLEAMTRGTALPTR